MSWLAIIWSIVAGLCFMLGLLHSLLWFKQRASHAYWLSALMAFSAGVIAITELALSQSVAIPLILSMSVLQRRVLNQSLKTLAASYH